MDKLSHPSIFTTQYGKSSVCLSVRPSVRNFTLAADPNITDLLRREPLNFGRNMGGYEKMAFDVQKL